jgi:imidazolonepropionase-like amidohydrolase
MVRCSVARLWTAVAGCVFALAAHVAAGASPIVVRNVNVVTMTSPEVLRDRNVVIRDGVIASIDAGGAMPSDATSIDGRGKYLMPGMCDMHVHLGDETVRTIQGDAIAPAIEHTRGELIVYVRSGLTCVRNMSGSPFHLELIKQIEAGRVLGPRTMTTTPIVDGDPPVWPFATKVTDPTQARALVQNFKAQGYDTIKVYNALSRDAYFAIVIAAREAGMKVVGHVPFSIGIWGALASGQYSIEHFRGYDFNPASAPGSSSASNRFAWWQSLKDEDLQRLARATADAGIYNVPTLNLMELAVDGEARAKLAKRPALADLPKWTRDLVMNDSAVKLFSSDALKAMRDSLPVQQRLLRYMMEDGAPILAGTDTPALGAIPGDALHRELELIAAASSNNFYALGTATTAPARYFNRSDRTGTVEPGKQADLVLLDANPIDDISNVRKIAGVILRGEWLSDSDLKSRLKKVSKQ